MKIFIITMDDPVQTYGFIKEIIDKRLKDIVGIAVPKGNRLTIKNNQSKFEYLCSLFLIMGPYHFLKNGIITLLFKTKTLFSAVGLCEKPSILTYAKKKGLLTYTIKTPNNKDFLQILRDIQPDLIINQSQSILKKEILSIPKLGIINRHNALLPKNRGRLTPFWVLFKKEKETGVSIHFVNEGIDSGDIILQEKFPVENNDTFNTLVKKNYEIAPKAMLKAIDILESGIINLISNKDSDATYNPSPRLSDAWLYRKSRIFK